MKIRNGFVSNSSSSSFIVIFDKKPKSVDEVMKILFHGKTREDHLSSYDDVTHIGDVVDTVFRDLTGQKKMTKKEIIEELTSGWNEFQLYADQKDIDQLNALEKAEEVLDREYYKQYHSLRKALGITPCDSLPKKTKANANLLKELNDLESNQRKHNQVKWAAIELLHKKMAETTYNALSKKTKGKFVAKFSYSDNDGTFNSIMEHGDVFQNVESIRISHH